MAHDDMRPFLVVTLLAAPAFASGDDRVPSPVRDTVRVHAHDIVTCYGKTARRSPDLQGRLVMEWTVADGRVTEVAAVEDELGSARLVRCVTRRIRRWRHPDDLSGTFRWPFTLTRRSR